MPAEKNTFARLAALDRQCPKLEYYVRYLSFHQSQKKNYDVVSDTYKTSYSIVNVSCESCHGAGKKHLDYINGDDYKSGEKWPVAS